jgi:hypothetical protein
MQRIRRTLLGALALLATSAVAGDVLVEIDEVHPGNGRTRFYVEATIVNQEEWERKQALRRDLRRAEVEWAQATGVLNELQPWEGREDWVGKVDEAIGAWAVAEENLEPYRHLHHLSAVTPWLYTPRPVAIRFDDESLARRAWLVNPFEVAHVHLRVWRGRWLRPPELVGEIQAPLRFIEGARLRFDIGTTGFAINGRVRVVPKGCDAQIVAAANGR